MKLVLTLSDQIPSGKNAMGVRRDGRHYPRKRFEDWRDQAGYEIMLQKAKWPMLVRDALPLTGDLVVTISYRELLPVPAKGTRDLPGCLDALWHLLTHMNLIENDGQIKGLTWQYPWRTEGPCVILEVSNG